MNGTASLSISADKKDLGILRDSPYISNTTDFLFFTETIFHH